MCKKEPPNPDWPVLKDTVLKEPSPEEAKMFENKEDKMTFKGVPIVWDDPDAEYVMARLVDGTPVQIRKPERTKEEINDEVIRLLNATMTKRYPSDWFEKPEPKETE